MASDTVLLEILGDRVEGIIDEVARDLEVNHMGLDKKNTHVLDGLASDPESECKSFERRIREAGGIDLQLLGIGRNGHIAFNEPGSDRDSRTRLVDLDEDTIKSNSRFFTEVSEVPTQALSMGIGTILESKKIILLATGEGKAHAISSSLVGGETPDVPASFLQGHTDVSFIVDSKAASDFMKGPQDLPAVERMKWLDIVLESELAELLLPPAVIFDVDVDERETSHSETGKAA
jgi:6-phosphogluconolactonase/glucosamine-6-phosphate isomerase/deaminase